jgi:PKD repeat protein
MNRRKFVSALFISMLLLLYAESILSFNVETKVIQATSLDLDELLLSKFDEYLAWITRKVDLNGTVVDTHDYSQYAAGGTKITLSVPLHLLVLAHMYEHTSNGFYLSMLRTLTEGVINNPTNYVTATGVGEVFFAAAYYYDGSEHDACVTQTGAMGIVATKLYLWTGEAKYKVLADRIADESLNELAVVNNSTDLAWSSAYYQYRDLTNAKKSVNRQGIMTWFYALYGKHINLTYSNYVPKIVNWMWRAQINYEGLAYDIGGSTTHNAYTAFAIYQVLYGYLVDPFLFSESLKEKIANSTKYLRDKVSGGYSYQNLYFLTNAFLSAWKSTDYFVDCIDVLQTKSMLYSALNSFHLTDIGFIPRLEHYSFGFRWAGYASIWLFLSYQLPDPSFDSSQYKGFGSYESLTGRYEPVGFSGGLDNIVEFTSGKSYYYGVKAVYGTATRVLGWTKVGYFTPASTTEFQEGGYYWKSVSRYGGAENYNVTVHLYPNGVMVGDIEGTNQPQMLLDNIDWKITVSNGTTYSINSLTSGRNYTFGNEMLIWYNATSLGDRRTFFVKTNATNVWTYELATYIYLKYSKPQTNHRLIYAVLTSWGDLITNQTLAFSTLKTLTDALDTTQPVSHDTMFDTYHSQVTALRSEASWKTLYQNSQSDKVKLIGHDYPQSTSINSWEYTSNKLIYTISSSRTSSTSKVYCGEKGKPTKVFIESIEQPINYDSSANILTITATHSSIPTEIVVDWNPYWPRASFFYSPLNPYSNDTVTFNASDSKPNGGDIISYQWDFGDGFVSQGVIVTHMYNKAGTYMVTLNVTDSEGLSNSTTTTVKVIMPPPPSIWKIEHSPELPEYGENVTITANITSQESGIDMVILNYFNGSRWTNTTMTIENGLYVATIPVLPYNTTVQYKVYASNDLGNWAETSTFDYTVGDTIPPDIGTVEWGPEKPSAGEEVIVSTQVSEPAFASGVKNVTLLWRVLGEDIQSSTMIMEDAFWKATISGQRSDTFIYFIIECRDVAGNRAESQWYHYRVKGAGTSLPLFVLIASAATVTLLIGVTIYVVRRRKAKDKIIRVINFLRTKYCQSDFPHI